EQEEAGWPIAGEPARGDRRRSAAARPPSGGPSGIRRGRSLDRPGETDGNEHDEERLGDRAGGAAPSHYRDRRDRWRTAKRVRGGRNAPRQGATVDPRSVAGPLERQAGDRDGDHADESGRGEDDDERGADDGAGAAAEEGDAVPARAVD